MNRVIHSYIDADITIEIDFTVMRVHGIALIIFFPHIIRLYYMNLIKRRVLNKITN